MTPCSPVAVLPIGLVWGLKPIYRFCMRIVSQVGRVLAWVVAVLIFSLGVIATPYAFRAALGAGTFGRITAERQECSNRGCVQYGTWRASPPSDQVVIDALMEDWPVNVPLGTSVDARYLGETSPAVVYAAGESFAWLYGLVVAGVAVVLVFVSRVALGEIRDDRREARRTEGYEPRRVASDLPADDDLR